MPWKLSGKLSPKRIKKPVLGTLKTGTKLVGAGILMEAGAEIAGHLSSKAQGVDEGSQYIMIEDLGPSFTRFDSYMLLQMDQNHVGSQALTAPSPWVSPSSSSYCSW